MSRLKIVGAGMRLETGCRTGGEDEDMAREGDEEEEEPDRTEGEGAPLEGCAAWLVRRLKLGGCSSTSLALDEEPVRGAAGTGVGEVRLLEGCSPCPKEPSDSLSINASPREPVRPDPERPKDGVVSAKYGRADAAPREELGRVEDSGAPCGANSSIKSL